MAVNYNDERFQQVTREQNAALQNLNNTYNNMISQSDKFYQDQIKAAEEYGNRQAEIQQANTDFTIEKINQQKEQAEKDYIKEQKGSYADWQKQSNQYGVHQEQLAAAGLRGGGYSESSQVDMYNQYQNRVSQARDSYGRAVLEYDNGIKEAQLTNNAKLAEISYNALKSKLELSLSGFQYKNQLLANQISQTQALNDTYYNRWKDVLNQINTENALAEQQRQFNEQMALQRQAQAASSVRVSSGGSSGGSSAIKNTSGGVAISGQTNSNGQYASEPVKTINGKTYIPSGDYGVDSAGNRIVLYKYGGKLYYYNGSTMKSWSGASTVSSAMKSIATGISKAK